MDARHNGLGVVPMAVMAFGQMDQQVLARAKMATTKDTSGPKSLPVVILVDNGAPRGVHNQSAKDRLVTERYLAGPSCIKRGTVGMLNMVNEASPLCKACQTMRALRCSMKCITQNIKSNIKWTSFVSFG